VTRREFALWSVAGIANLAITALFTVPGAAYLFGPVLRRDRNRGWASVGPAARFRGGAVHRVAVERASGAGYARSTREQVAYVTELEGELVAFDSECPHMGCNVAWAADKQQFECPCHGGKFSQTGAVQDGPPKRALWRYPLRIEQGELQLELGGHKQA